MTVSTPSIMPIMRQQKMNLAGQRIFMLQLLLLAVAITLLYGNFLASPLVFDDHSFFQAILPELRQTAFSLDLRRLPQATFEWTRALPGENLWWWRMGNLLLHITNTFLLLLLLRKLFAAVLAGENATPPANNMLSSSWLAFFGALMFALHPVAVYGVAYLVQRTGLMATLFALLTWWLFSTGLQRNRQGWLLASAATYLLAVLSKEHAIMVPAVCAALLLLLRKPDKQLFSQVWPTFLLYGLVAVFILYQIKHSTILGHAYEPGGAALLLRKSIDPATAYPLSVLTQSFLYFKYVGLWLVPNPAWMSVNMLENFAARLWTWPETAALIAFIGYPIVALRLLLQRGRNGLLGFALLCPWLLFATELSTVRIQEVFVLYRSYLWMPGVFAALPFLFQKLPAKYSAAILITITLAFIPATWNRLTVFSDPVLLWGDALRLAPPGNAVGTGKIYLNRGVAYAEQKLFPQAIQDLSEAIRLIPRNSVLYSNRATAYRESGQYALALDDYNIALRLNPNVPPAYLDRAKVHEVLGNSIDALRDYAQSCQMGMVEGCAKSAQ